MKINKGNVPVAIILISVALLIFFINFEANIEMIKVGISSEGYGFLGTTVILPIGLIVGGLRNLFEKENN